jgi:hypothetical protein
MAKTAKDLVKKDLKENKLKVPELDETTKKHLEQMSLLEIRAELDPYLIDNPAARLGFDIIERGEKVDGKSGGELLAMIAGGEEGLYNYNFRNPMYGMSMPSNELRSHSDGNFRTADTFPDKYRLTTQVLKNQGIRSLLPASEGSTIYYETGYVDDPKAKGYYEKAPSDQGLSTLMEELAHLGVRYVQNETGGMKRGAFNMPFDLADEERVMDVMQQRSADKRGVYSDPRNKVFYYSNSIPMQNMEQLDKEAIKALKARGITATPIEQAGPTIMERLLGMFN